MVSQYLIPSELQITSRVLVLLFLIVCVHSKWYYAYSTTTKILFGMGLAILAYVISTFTRIFKTQITEYSYQLLMFPQFLLLEFADVLVSAPSLELAYSKSPPSMRFALSSFYNLVCAIDKIIWIKK